MPITGAKKYGMVLAVDSRMVLHLSPANGSHTCVDLPLRVIHPDDQLPDTGPHTNGMSSASGAPSPLRSPTTHLYEMLMPTEASCGALAVATVRATPEAIVACEEPWTGRSWAPARAPKSTAFCRTWRSWYSRLMSITNATAANRMTTVNANNTAIAPRSSFKRFMGPPFAGGVRLIAPRTWTRTASAR